MPGMTPPGMAIPGSTLSGARPPLLAAAFDDLLGKVAGLG